MQRIREDIRKGNRSTSSLLQEGLGATISNRMTDRMTIRSIGSLDSVFVTCFGADLEPEFATF